MKIALIALVALAIALLGCSGATEKKIVGKYKAQLTMPEGKKDDPSAPMAKGFAEALVGSMSLEIKEGKAFTMTAMGFPIEGTWTLNGDKLTLTPTKVMGMDPKTASKDSTSKSDEPMELTVSSDGKTLMPTKKAGPSDPDFRFVRE